MHLLPISLADRLPRWVASTVIELQVVLTRLQVPIFFLRHGFDWINET